MTTKHTFSILYFIRKEKSTEREEERENGSKKKFKLAPIYMRITIDGKRSHYSIKRYIDPDRWDSKAHRVIGTKEDEHVHPYLSSSDILDKHEMQSSGEIIERIEMLSLRCKDMNFYEILKVPNFADEDRVRKAYYRQAKEFHPDRHFHLSADIKEKLEMIFSYINEAYITLIDPHSKEKYDKSLIVKKPTNVSDEEFARKQFKEGKLAFWNGNYPEAEQLFMHILSTEKPEGKYHYYYAKTLSKLEKYKEAERTIKQAIESDPSHPDYMLEAGYIYCSLGLMHKAKDCFEKVLKLQPSNNKAKKQLALLTQNPKGFFKKLFSMKRSRKKQI